MEMGLVLFYFLSHMEYVWFSLIDAEQINI